MKIVLVGDVMLGRLVNRTLKEEPPRYVWGNTLPVFEAADFRVCNLECVISDRGSPWSATPKIFHYRTDAKNVEALKPAWINGVSLANNHVLDYEEDALLDCTKILDDRKILHAGAGANIDEARRPFIVEVKGIRLGFLAFTDNEPGWAATENTPGVFYVPVDTARPESGQLMDLVSKTKEAVDFLVVSAHWGPNWGYEPPPEHVEFAHALIDAGADLVYGHSPHIFRGIEIYNGRPILYSTGDFIDDYAVDEVERNDQSFVFALDLTEQAACRLLLYPTVIRNFQANLARGLEARQIMAKMQSLCARLGTSAIREDDRLEIWIDG